MKNIICLLLVIGIITGCASKRAMLTPMNYQNIGILYLQYFHDRYKAIESFNRYAELETNESRLKEVTNLIKQLEK